MELLPRHWRNRFAAMMQEPRSWSKDPSTQVGALIVTPDRRQISTGYNGLPRGMSDDYADMDRARKLRWTIHAEHNAVLNAAFDVAGCHLFSSLPLCCRCAAVALQVGIGAVYFPPMPSDLAERWGDEFAEAEAELRGHGVMVVKLWECGR